jgi:hypothetical protein
MAAPRSLGGEVAAAARRAKDIQEIRHMFGAGAMPKAPIAVLGPDGNSIIMVVGDGVTEASELQDIAAEAYDRQAETIKRTGNGSDFAGLREKHGYRRKEDFDRALREALQERIARHKASPITDPFRVPKMPAPENGAVQFAVNGTKES